MLDSSRNQGILNNHVVYYGGNVELAIPALYTYEIILIYTDHKNQKFLQQFKNTSVMITNYEIIF